MTPIRRTLAPLTLLSSLVLAAYAQLIISNADHWSDGWPLVSTFDAKLTELYRAGTFHGEQSVAAAIILFAVAMVLFVWAVRLSNHGSSATTPPSNAPSSDTQHGRVQVPILLGGFAAFAGWCYLMVRLATGSYEGWYVGLFFGSLALIAILFVLADRARSAGLSFAMSFRIWEIAFVSGVAGLFFGLVVQDLTNWRYASLGDDSVFFAFAAEIASGDLPLNLFSQVEGPYSSHPLLSSAYQASVMEFAGENIFGWKLATLLTLVATIPIFYWLIRALTNTRTAVFASAILASAHYLLGYAHTGYDNVFPLLPTVLALAFFVGGTKRSSMFLFFCSGAIAGLGFYTYFSGRAVIIILALAVLFLGRKRWRPELVLPLAIGFVLAVGPLFAVDGWNVIDEMQARSQAEGRSPFEIISGLAASAPRVFLAFNFNPYPKHFVSGSLLDDVSAPLALLGLAYTATRVRNERYRLLLIWFLVGIVVTGLFHPIQELINTRLHYVLPTMAAFAGIAIDRLITLLERLTPLPRARPALAALCIAGLFPAILGLNLYRHIEVSPKRIPAMSAALVYREAQEASCDQPGLRTIVFAARPFPVMPRVFEFYNWEDKTPLFFRYDDPPNVYEDAIGAGNVGCVLLADPQQSTSGRASAYLAELSDSALSVEEVSDASGRTTLLVLRLAEVSPP